MTSPWGELHGGASPEVDPDTAGHRAEVREWERTMHDLAPGRHRLHDRNGMRVDPHPGDSRPERPTRDGNRSPFHPDDDPTGHRFHQWDPSPMVLVGVTCSHPGCEAHGTWYGRGDTLHRVRQAGGPRCTDHPLDPDALDRIEAPQPRARGA